MSTASFRFYEELNDFLPVHRRKIAFTSTCAENATVKQAIEALGVPHTEVEVILVNGESVDFTCRVHEGDRVSIYPMFESLDVRPILRLREAVLRRPRFVADAHLGRLARYLRMLGFDTLYENAAPDRQLVGISRTERRVLLTRDRNLLMHRELTHGVFVRGDRPRDQLRHVVERLDLRSDCLPFSRCMNCNAALEEIDRSAVIGEVPPTVERTQRHFRRCTGCRHVYWRGTHYERMLKLVNSVLEGCGRS
jgi:uncharacterized protein with PIN domain/sulfur carrier protein ThiS